MDSFSISFKPSVDKDLRRLPKSLILRVMEKIEDLKSEPFPPQAVKISVADRLYRLRVGDYRIVYEVEVKKKIITIHYIRHRSVVYRDL
jgi:mRNA interferase RelE/StbE